MTETLSSIAAAMRVCDQSHGGESNTATVYGHHASIRTCIRMFDSDTWVYDPRWEEPR